MTVKQQCLSIIAKTGDLYLGQTRGVIENLFHRIEAEVEEPTDVVPVVHGEWVEKQNPWGQDGSHTYVCSVCNESISILGNKPNYCPKCGAKMDKDNWLNTRMTESIEV